MRISLPHPLRKRTTAMSLVEMIVALGLGSVVLGSAGVVFIYSLFSFAGLGNYAILTGQSKLSLDYISREMREATHVVSYTTNDNVRTLILSNGAITTTLAWDPDTGILTFARPDESPRTFLTGCDRWDVNFYQRSPQADWGFHPTSNLSLCKLINMNWKCSRSNPWQKNQYRNRCDRAGSFAKPSLGSAMLANLRKPQVRTRPSTLNSPPSTSLAQRGSVLVTTLVLCSILGLTLAGYLYWVRTQNVLVAQSQAWNVSLAYAEAGIEEGMAQINVYFDTNYIPSATANWGGGYAAGQFGPTHNFTDGSYSAIIVPEIGAPGPTIISTGYCFVPLLGKRVARVVKVTTASVSPFNNAITVRSNLTAKGTGLTIDSFDSDDPLHSTTNGMYDPATRKAGGDVNSTGGLIDVQNAEIYGHLNTGPEGSFVIGQGSVGDLDWNVPGQIQDGWYANDFNMDIKEVKPPYSSGAPVVAVTTKQIGFTSLRATNTTWTVTSS